MIHLRQQTLDELQRRNYSQSTARCYIHALEDFAKYSIVRQSGLARSASFLREPSKAALPRCDFSLSRRCAGHIFPITPLELVMRACATLLRCIRTGLSSRWKPPHLCGGRSASALREVFPVRLCALALVAAKKRGPFMVRGSHASYQDRTLDGPKRTQQRFGLYE